MKIKTIGFALLTITNIISSSCSKDKKIEPVNVEATTEVPACTTCPSSFITLDSVTTSVLGTSGVIHSSYANSTNFTIRNGTTYYGGHQSKTTKGFYGFNGLAIDFNLSALSLSSIPSQVSFTHARLPGNIPGPPSGGIAAEENLINIKFTGTPLIKTTPDSLGYYLAPFGYTVYHYYYPTIINQSPTVNFGAGFAYADSIVIVGVIPNDIRIGVNLFESELRNICFK